MKEAGCLPNAVTFLTLIGGCVKGGQSQGVAARLVDEMVDAQCKPIPSLSSAVISACVALTKKEISQVCQKMSDLGAAIFSHVAKLLLQDDLDHQQVKETAVEMLGEMGREWGKVFKARFLGAVCHALWHQGLETRATIVLSCGMEASLVPLGTCVFEEDTWVLDLRSMSAGIAITIWWLWLRAIQKILAEWRTGGERQWEVSDLFPLLPPNVVWNTGMQHPVLSAESQTPGHGVSRSKDTDERVDQEGAPRGGKVVVRFSCLPTELVLVTGIGRGRGDEMDGGIGGMREVFQTELERVGSPFRVTTNRGEMSASLGAVVKWLRRSGPEITNTGARR
ncbi:hypothetical protein CBR_g36480 [Chara braunii]|uniref:Smr domain-containing protein n=1 Tax=Chara braunii TaxID=69332 RepID=A0A388LKX4_CHABU|nr:hypothetical protein CBR_g36480 [Chara braunii]|eukprot:GBG82954.1 hypothetical protein CBR_g36480 [Chara braunii]